MYGLPSNIDLTFLHGRELLQVCIGMHQVILNFYGQLSISIESEYAHRSRSGEVTRYEDCRLSASMLTSFVGLKISRATGTIDGTLTLCFSNEDVLEIYDDSKQHESYQIRNGSS